MYIQGFQKRGQQALKAGAQQWVAVDVLQQDGASCSVNDGMAGF
jgi:hypothetical protein